MPRTAKSFAEEIQTFWDRTDADNRDLTAEERIALSELVVQAKSQHDIEKSIREIGLQMGPGGEHVVRSDGSGVRGGSPGEQFVMSKGYTAIRDAGGRAQSWTSGPIDCGPHMLTKGTLLEGAGAPGSGTGGGFVPVPQVVPGVVDKLFQPLTFEDLLLSGQATGPVVRYGVEGTALSAAAGVAEAGLKPRVDARVLYGGRGDQEGRHVDRNQR